MNKLKFGIALGAAVITAAVGTSLAHICKFEGELEYQRQLNRYHQSQIVGLLGELSAVNSAVNGNLTLQEDYRQQLNTQLDELINYINSINSGLEGFSADISGNSSQIKTLEGKVNEAQQLITDLQSTISIVSQDGKVKDIYSQLAALNAQLGACQQRLFGSEGLESRVNINSAAISGFTKQLQGLQNQVQDCLAGQTTSTKTVTNTFTTTEAPSPVTYTTTATSTLNHTQTVTQTVGAATDTITNVITDTITNVIIYTVTYTQPAATTTTTITTTTPYVPLPPESTPNPPSPITPTIPAAK